MKMASKFARCVRKVRKKNKKVNPYAVCKVSLKKNRKAVKRKK